MMVGPAADAAAPSVAELKLRQKLRTGQRGKRCREISSTSQNHNFLRNFVNGERGIR